jgi:hypothetical protein
VESNGGRKDEAEECIGDGMTPRKKTIPDALQADEKSPMNDDASVAGE